jgi:hypothetical protein
MLNEVHRITRGGGTVHIITPHYTSQLSYGDFTHLHHLGYITFHTLRKTGLFRIRRHKLWFTDLYKAFGVSLLANRWPRRWEKYFGFVLPALYIEVELEVIKSGAEGNALVDRYMY